MSRCLVFAMFKLITLPIITKLGWMVYHVILMPEEFLEQVKSSSTLGSLQIQRLIWIIPLLMARLKVHGLSFGSADYTWLILKLIQTCLINVTFNLKHFITSDTELHIRIVKKIFLSYTCFILEVQISIVICQQNWNIFKKAFISYQQILCKISTDI